MEDLTPAPQVSSAIAILGRRTPEASRVAEQVGATVLEPKAILHLNGFKADVVVLMLDDLRADELQVIVRMLTGTTRASRVILVGSGSTLDPAPMMKAIQLLSIYAWVETLHSSLFQEQAMHALDDASESKQTAESLALYIENNESLQKLSQELEARIEARKQELSESTSRLQQNQRRNEVLQRALNAVHVSHSVPEIERFLTQVLSAHSQTAGDIPGVDWVRITFAAQSRLEASPLDQRTGAVFSVALGGTLDALNNRGHIHFGRPPDRPFRSDDRSFLTLVAEAVALAVTRMQTVERMDQVKREWEETFNAIAAPVAVLDDQLRFVRGNRALLRGRKPEDLVGRPCFEAVFGRKTACPGCPLIEDLAALQRRDRRGREPDVAFTRSRQFRLDREEGGHSSTFEVTSRPIESQLLVHLYRDVTPTVRFEKRILESAKMAELGTIGSSIAHQLNNPIGGMLSLIQLLLMDLDSQDFPGKEDFRLELKEMEAGTRRCAQIVRDLLGFSRRGIEDAPDDHELREIIEQAVKITELQTRSRGVRFKIETPEKPSIIHGRFNLLAQAIRAVLLAMLPVGLRDYAVDLTIVDDPQSDSIQVKIDIPPVKTDVIAPSSHSTEEKLDLTVAEQILVEHEGSLQLRQKTGENDLVQQAILSLPRPKVRGP